MFLLPDLDPHQHFMGFSVISPHPSSKCSGNLSSSFCFILTNQGRWKQKVMRYHFVLDSILRLREWALKMWTPHSWRGIWRTWRFEKLHQLRFSSREAGSSKHVNDYSSVNRSNEVSSQFRSECSQRHLKTVTLKPHSEVVCDARYLADVSDNLQFHIESNVFCALLSFHTLMCLEQQHQYRYDHW